MFNGTIYLTKDINLCIANLAQCKIIGIVENLDAINIPNIICGSNLLPPIEAVSALIDGNNYAFKAIYLDYLRNNPQVKDFIDILLQALMVGINIILLIDPEGPDFVGPLKEVFATDFGIFLGDEGSEYCWNALYLPKNLTRLYNHGGIDIDTFLKYFPNEAQFDPMTLNQMIAESGLYCSVDFAYSYFKNRSALLKIGGNIRTPLKRS